MGGINFARVIGGGLAAALVIFVFEGALSALYADRMAATLAQHSLTMQMDAGSMLLAALLSLLQGLVIVFFYAACRMRFGPGPRTAIIVSIAVYLAGYLSTLLGYSLIGLYPADLLALWALQGLIELIAAGLVGAWLYREDPTRLGTR